MYILLERRKHAAADTRRTW